MVAKRIVERRIALISSATPATREHRDASQSAVEKPKIAIAAAPDDDRDRDRDALAANVADPAGGQRGEQRARRRRGVEQADDPGAGVEVVRGDRREERLRHPEDHRVRVEHERPEDHRLPDEEPPPLAQRFERLAGRPRPSAAPARSRDGDSEARERRGVDHVRPAEPDGGDQHAAERRARRSPPTLQ